MNTAPLSNSLLINIPFRMVSGDIGSDEDMLDGDMEACLD